MGKNNPFFSVVIPAYNEEKYLPKCLGAIFSQDFPRSKYEVIIVDNASTDKTSQIAQKFPAKLVREPKKGVVKARTAGLNYAEGEYVVNLDADCISPPEWLSRIYRHLRRDHKIVSLSGPCIFVPKGDPFLYRFFNFFMHFSYQLLGSSLGYWAGNMTIKKEALLNIGGYDLELPVDQLSLLGRLRKTGGINAFQNDVLVYHSPRRVAKRGILRVLLKENLWLYLVNNCYIKIGGRSLGDWEDIR